MMRSNAGEIAYVTGSVLKSLFLLTMLLGSNTAYCQLFSVGIKGGLPLSEAFKTVNFGNNGFTSETRKYIVGPMAEIHLPFRLSIEVDALYRRTDYDSFFAVGSGLSTLSGSASTRLNNWQFPFLAKYEPTKRFFRPFIDAGVTYRYVSGKTGTSGTDTIVAGTGIQSGSSSLSGTHSFSAAVDNPNTAGFTVGGGVSLKVPFIKISLEIRYTRWGSNPISQTFVKSNGNQTDFLLGITF